MPEPFGHLGDQGVEDARNGDRLGLERVAQPATGRGCVHEEALTKSRYLSTQNASHMEVVLCRFMHAVRGLAEWSMLASWRSCSLFSRGWRFTTSGVSTAKTKTPSLRESWRRRNSMTRPRRKAKRRSKHRP